MTYEDWQKENTDNFQVWQQENQQFRKPIGEAAISGFKRGGAFGVKGIAGIAEAVGETFEAKRYLVPSKIETFIQEKAGKLKEWGREMASAADQYFKENPQEAPRIESQGFLPVLYEYIRKPELIIQGAIESAPLLLEGGLGTVIAGPGGGIVVMAGPIAGDTYHDARQEGTEPTPALAQAILTGLGEAAIEQWTLGKQIGLVTAISKGTIRKGLGKWVWEGAKMYFRGTAEEGSQQFNQNFWRWVFTDRSQKLWENVPEQAAAGGPLELAMGGGFVGAGAVGNLVSKSEQINRVEKIKNAVRENKELSDIERTEIYNELDKVTEDVNKGTYEDSVVQPKEKIIEGPSYEEIERTEKKIEPTILETIQKWANEKQLSPEEYLKELHEAVKESPRNKSRREYILGHTIPKQLGWSEEQRKGFMTKLTEKDSMKKMTPKERVTYVEALKKEAADKKIDISDPKIQAIELIETIQQTKKLPTELEIEKINETGIKKLERQVCSGAELIYENNIRIERFLEGLDGHHEGAHIENIWKPIKQTDEFAIENENRRIEEFRKYLENQDIDIAIWMGKTDHIADKIDLTASQRIGIYTLSQNEDGLRHLQKGYGLTDEAIKLVVNFMSPQEKVIGDWLLKEYESQWPILYQVAVNAGIDPKKLKQEYRYTPLILRNVDIERQTDFISDLTSAFVPEATLPPKGMLIERSEHADQPVELDAFLLYMYNLHRVERFNAMAPTVSKVGKILNNREYRKTLNDATYGHGSKILHTWLRDASRGHAPAAVSWIDKMFRILRKNGIVYAIGYNIPSALRQTISLSNAFAVDPAMWKYGPGNTLKAMTPEGYRELQNYCYEKSLELKTRDYEQDLRRTWNRSELSKRLRGKDPFSRKATAWIRWMDRHTCVVAWKSLYDVATSKGMNDEAAIAWADKWMARTQPMANAKDLPQFFRGGTIERVLATFQNQVNNNGNFYIYDIIEAKMTGEIGWTMVGYRTMFSYILPAILFGMIGRARLPEDWNDIAVDLVTYPLATFFLIGRYMDRVIRGWGQSESIAEAPLEEAVRFGRAIEKGDWRGILRGAATNMGTVAIAMEKPGPTAQMIRTGQGLYDLYAGKTNDPRRLIYSKWALEQGKPKDVGIRRRKLRRRKLRE